MSRFTAKHSDVLLTTVSDARRKDWQRVYCGAFRSPAGNLTIAVVNDSADEFAMKLSWASTTPQKRFFRYRYGKPQFDRADVQVNPEKEFSAAKGSGWTDVLPPQSLTIYSTYELKNNDAGVLVDENPK
jgi:hypothetical protein